VIGAVAAINAYDIFAFQMTDRLAALKLSAGRAAKPAARLFTDFLIEALKNPVG
jgi:hypothetical protein